MSERPNIVYILADDLGFGDVACNDPDCRIPTPRIDDLARGGLRFTDAHATSAVCTPSRYGVLTGRYAWRSRLKRGIVWPWDGSLIEQGRQTVAELLGQQGYRTACIGKWHLGWDWPTLDGTNPNDSLEFGAYCDAERAAYEVNIDYTRPAGGGPTDRGFDSYFGVDVPNFTPYTWFEDDRVTEPPSEAKPDSLYGHPGRAVPGWEHEAMIPAFTRRAVQLIEQAATDGEPPLFLFLALTSPHSPIAPNDEFQGVSGIGAYGDFVCEVDWVVGQVMDALYRTEQFDDTLLILTSDNGPETGTADDEGVYTRALRTGHFSMGPLRGVKRDVWEGGHRVPFIASWPRTAPADETCDRLVSLADLIATCADILGTELPADAGEDSVSLLPLLSDPAGDPSRDSLVLHSAAGKFAVRHGDWIYIDAPGGGDGPEPEWYRSERGLQAHDEPGELYDLANDPGETTNLYAHEPERVTRMKEILRRAQAS